MIASRDGNLKMVELLLNHSQFDITVDLQDDKGKTVLHHCCENGHPAITELLVGKGADLRIKDKEGKTALDVSKKGKGQGHEECVRLLKVRRRKMGGGLLPMYCDYQSSSQSYLLFVTTGCFG